jgi:hypothetical protein
MATVASSAAGFVWEDPGDSIMIQVSMDLVDRLGAAVKKGLGTGPRGTEIGGLLLGKTLPGFGRTILIEDFELMPCEYLRGASYTLSPADRKLLGARLARTKAGRVVGYFRSHTRPGMYLDQEDFAVFGRYFPEPSQVFLLVRPSMNGAATGGFFFWEDGDVNRRSPYRQFPFDSEMLSTGGYPITGGAPPIPTPAPALGPRLAPIAVPKPVTAMPAREPRERGMLRKAPQIPWMVVPIIAGLFLIAGLFVTENRPAKQDGIVPAKVSPPAETVEPLLPEPEPQAAVPPTETEPVSAAAPTPETAPRPITAPAQKALPPVTAEAPTPVKAVRAPVHLVEAPPVLATPMEKPTPALAALLPSHANAAPPREAQVSYEQPRAGVFKRAIHKIEREEFVPASPTRQVAPAAAGGVGAVDVKVFIDESGSVTRAQVLTKGSDLAARSVDAARQWRFTPARKHDKAVSSEMVLHFQF